MCLFSPSLYIISCIKNSHCIGGPNNCISEKKVKLAYLPLKKSSHLQQQLTSKCVIYHTICHTEARLCQKRKKKKIIIGVFIFSIISFHKLCQQNQNAFLSRVKGRAALGRAAVASEIDCAG